MVFLYWVVVSMFISGKYSWLNLAKEWYGVFVLGGGFIGSSGVIFSCLIFMMCICL